VEALFPSWTFEHGLAAHAKLNRKLAQGFELIYKQLLDNLES